MGTGGEYNYEHYIQDWLVGLEVDADFESDPICREAGRLAGKLWREEVLKSKKSMFMEDPPAPSPKDPFDVKTIEKRVKALNSPFTKIGCEVSFETNTSLGEVKAKAFVRNLQLGMSLAISQNVAELLAVKKIAKKLNLS